MVKERFTLSVIFLTTRTSTLGILFGINYFRNDKKAKKRDLKRKYKAKKNRFQKIDKFDSSKPIKRTGTRPVLDGVSIFDLIIPWKAEALKDKKVKEVKKVA
jgi:hypothetical protein